MTMSLILIIRINTLLVSIEMLVQLDRKIQVEFIQYKDDDSICNLIIVKTNSFTIIKLHLLANFQEVTALKMEGKEEG